MQQVHHGIDAPAGVDLWHIVSAISCIEHGETTTWLPVQLPDELGLKKQRRRPPAKVAAEQQAQKLECFRQHHLQE